MTKQLINMFVIIWMNAGLSLYNKLSHHVVIVVQYVNNFTFQALNDTHELGQSMYSLRGAVFSFIDFYLHGIIITIQH